MLVTEEEVELAMRADGKTDFNAVDANGMRTRDTYRALLELEVLGRIERIGVRNGQIVWRSIAFRRQAQ